MTIKVKDSSGYNLNIGDIVRCEKDDVFRQEIEFRVEAIQIFGKPARPMAEIVASSNHGITITAAPETFFKKRGFLTPLEFTDERGSDIGLGDTVWYEGQEIVIKGFNVTDEGVSILCEEITRETIWTDEVLLSERLDSWDALEADIKLGCECKIEKLLDQSCGDFNSCEDCITFLAKYFIDRAKKIAEREA